MNVKLASDSLNQYMHVCFTATIAPDREIICS